ncbi:MAG TPA: ABC transporter ATP-binding protein [Myxococcales bacterium]|nr:ABC transporter ATP-binding protein [Myxococcales bacterium]
MNEAPTQQPPIVEASGIGKRFGDHWAVRHLGLQIRQGEIYGLLGPNGAGKTTTLRMIAGLIEPDQGDVRVAGADPRNNPMEVKKKIGFLTGTTGLYARLTPIELLTFFGKLQEIPKKTLKDRIDQLIEDLGLGEFCKQLCGTLSTGQTQRVSIARTLLHNPQLLILDEPTSGLDIISAEFILNAIRTAKSEGRTVLFSTHILVETELLSDRIGILHKGTLAKEGTLDVLLEETGQTRLADAFLKVIEESQQHERQGA